MPGNKKRLLYWFLPFVVAISALGLSRLNTAEMLERRFLDVRFKLRGTRSVDHTPFQIVAVDDQTFSLLDEKWPFKGSFHARLIRNLNRAGARLIAFDIEFTESNAHYPEEDSLFAQAIQEAGNVILAGKMAYTFGDYIKQPYSMPVSPIPELLESGSKWGIINDLPDADDFTRRYLLYLPHGDHFKRSLGLEVLSAMHQIPDTSEIHIQNQVCRYGSLQIPLYDRQSFLINYYGPAGTFPAVSFASVLDDSTYDFGPEHDSDYMELFIGEDPGSGSSLVLNPFAGKVVLVGVSAAELSDNKNTPFYDFELTPREMPGVEIHAHALQTILDASFIRRIPFVFVLLGNLFLAYFVFHLVAILKPLRGLALSAFMTLSVFVTAFALFSWWNLWIDFMPLLLTSILAFIAASVFHYNLEREEKACLKDMFSRFVPDEVIEELVRKPELLRLGGERRRLTILFADLEGFTTIAEKTAPETLVEMLNEYMTALTEIILDHGGIIDKYEGDLIMAEFGIPVPREDHGVGACSAALKMRDALLGLHEKWERERRPTPRLRIGINTGEATVGNMGSNEVFDYTVLGDTVNLCSRLEEANKIYGTTILISQATKDELPPAFVTRELGDLHVRGRSSAVLVYELIAESASVMPNDHISLLEVYQLGLSRIQNGKWAEAAVYFERALELDPDDRPSQDLLERCRQHIETPALETLVPSE